MSKRLKSCAWLVVVIGIGGCTLPKEFFERQVSMKISGLYGVEPMTGTLLGLGVLTYDRNINKKLEVDLEDLRARLKRYEDYPILMIPKQEETKPKGPGL